MKIRKGGSFFPKPRPRPLLVLLQRLAEANIPIPLRMWAAAANITERELRDLLR